MPLSWVHSGPWEWKSFPGNSGLLCDGKTVLRIPCGKGYQHILEIDWADYRDHLDVEELATLICKSVNKAIE